MLTPIDQPLDKLEDLTPEEMLVLRPPFSVANADAYAILSLPQVRI
jgi:hypothetical protein